MGRVRLRDLRSASFSQARSSFALSDSRFSAENCSRREPVRRAGNLAFASHPSAAAAIKGSCNPTGLPEACCDAAFLRGVYHHLTEPTATAADLFMALRPIGDLAVIDFPPSRWLSIFFPTTGVPSNRGGHGIQPETRTRYT
jgi:hypothetical protein